MECIKAHFQDFTEPCKAALVRIAAVREPCGTDTALQSRAVTGKHEGEQTTTEKALQAYKATHSERMNIEGSGTMSKFDPELVQS